MNYSAVEKSPDCIRSADELRGYIQSMNDPGGRIKELEATNRSLTVRLICAEAALQFTPAQLDALHGVIRRIGHVIEGSS